MAEADGKPAQPIAPLAAPALIPIAELPPCVFLDLLSISSHELTKKYRPPPTVLPPSEPVKQITLDLNPDEDSDLEEEEEDW